MPSLDKERPSGRLGRLLAALRPSRAGPLPVQTGFPTSLADLVVKNHGRLKKQPSPSSKLRKGGGSASTSPSTSPSPAPPSPPQPPSSPPAAAAVSSSDQPRPDLSVSQAIRRDKSCTFGLGLGFLAVSGVVSLALLVIWSKKVVAAVTVASFSLFLLESLRCSSLSRRQRPRPRPAEATETQLYLDGRGRVSPICEVEAESTEPSRRPSCSDSDRGVDAAILSAEEKSGVLDESISSKAKAKAKKRSWKKLIASAKKLHKGRRSKEAEDRPGSSFHGEGDPTVASVRGHVRRPGSHRGRDMANETDVTADDAIADEPGSPGSRRRRSSEIRIWPMEVDSPADLVKEEDEEAGVEEQVKAGIRFPCLVLVAVVLVGLVAGKLPALAFTMLCAAFFSSVPRVHRHGAGDGSRRRRPERLVPVSS